ncbi:MULTISPECIES: efflux transporter outer membrane subunit [unclassified Variovorax]|uniref:efflux transporter outer membrane subunit n=1 Tax=unclassified Variovorax TaxID=663243 RepID=UPI003F48082C
MHASQILSPRRRVRTLALFALGVMLAGCAAGPEYHPLTPSAASTWQAVVPHDGSVSAMVDWWRQFDDPVLGRLIVQAETDSPSLDKAWTKIEKARATLTTTRAGGLPSLSGSGSLSRARQQTTEGGAPVLATSRSADLDASWELDLFGKVRRNAQAAQARIDARVDDWHDARVSLAAEVADTYVQYRACGLLTQAYERELASMTETEKATAVAVRAGFTAPSDGALARASLASTTSTLLSQRAECELLVKSLVNLTGFDEAALRALMAHAGAQVPQPAALAVPSVPAQALRQRPDLASSERELAASSAEIGAAVADLYPSLSLTGSITVSASNLSSSVTTWSLGPSLSIPIFDAGKRRAAVDSAQASYRSALADYRQSVRDAVKEIEQALVRLDSTARRADQAGQAAQEYRRYFEATEVNWRAGGASLLTLEEARRSALSAQVDEIALQRNRVQYWIALYKALGGGWQPDSPALPPQQTNNQ